MITAKGADFNRDMTAHADALLSAGYSFVGRYLCNPANSKTLTAKEAQHLSSKGLFIVSVFEDGYPISAGYFTSQRAQRDGTCAFHWAKAAGQPLGSVIYFAVDYDASEHEVQTVIVPYFKAVQQGMEEAAKAAGETPYAVGVYGSGLVCGTLSAEKLVVKMWLSMSKGWTESKNYYASNLWSINQTEYVTIAGVEGDGNETQGAGGGWKYTG